MAIMRVAGAGAGVVGGDAGEEDGAEEDGAEEDAAEAVAAREVSIARVSGNWGSDTANLSKSQDEAAGPGAAREPVHPHHPR
ncbi:hypothetical protein ROR02_01700 [Pararhodospirillum oryzae]|uniref:Uncharacterized protein n=1 Tax=Pararhodospirillum oryzae TaxID=478448 RepID=A0A512H3K3_9PROT|nr:hypothetical protein ROR02_01700 [Pararhodospirillum oryzae]